MFPFDDVIMRYTYTTEGVTLDEFSGVIAYDHNNENGYEKALGEKEGHALIMKSMVTRTRRNASVNMS